jgi:hypothetical protein
MRLSTLLLIMVGIVFVASYGEDAPNLNLDYAIYVSAYCICRTLEKGNEQ